MVSASRAEEEKPRRSEIRFLCFAPSPYTNRHDALRAGLGIHLLLENLIRQNKLPLRTTFIDGSKALDNANKARSLLRGADLILVGSSTWAQGSNYYVRRFFELVGDQSLDGVAVSAWSTAGGFHTGGETAVSDTLRSLMGMGGQAFTLFQKLMVFSLDERQGGASGDFTLLDCWYMDQFARRIAVVALAHGDPQSAERAARKLGSVSLYFRTIPANDELSRLYSNLQQRLNSAANSSSKAYQELASHVSP